MRRRPSSGSSVRRKTQETLRKAKKELAEVRHQAEEVLALKDDFLASVNHELRTPLTAIKEGVALLLDGATGPINREQEEFLQAVNQNIDRLIELVNKILDLSKIQTGRMVLHRRRLHLEETLLKVIEKAKEKAHPRTFHLKETPCEVFADPDRVLQILENLLENAIKFTEEGGQITFSVQKGKDDALISIEDDGVGIAKGNLPKLFQKFSQICPNGYRRGGMGLGLAMCKLLVEGHHGKITAASTPGNGSKFTFTLPLYVPKRVFIENFQEMTKLVKQNQGEELGLMVFNCKTLLGCMCLKSDGSIKGRSRRDCLEALADTVRRNVHFDDQVVALEPHWVIVLAITDIRGTQAIAGRLQQFFRRWTEEWLGVNRFSEMKWGCSFYPSDGARAQTLLDKAVRKAVHEART